MKEQKWIIGIAVGVIAAVSIFFFLSKKAVVISPTDVVASAERVAFGTFLKQNGVIFYGAFWCPHCQKQKKDLGEAVWKPVYVECSTPDGKDEFPVCKDAKIDSFPTWVFKDGTRQSGEITEEELIKKTGYKPGVLQTAPATTSVPAK